jgi:choloylglycine hydrolase
MQYILDTCATVDDVIASNELVRNITVDHYLVADRTGAVAVIEYLDGELVARTGDDLPVGVLSNWYYEDSLRLWQRYRNTGSYSWMDGSLQRFCIAADRVSSFGGTTVEDGISYAFDTLEAIAGENFSEHASQWSMVFDTCALRVYFKTLAQPDLRYVDLEDFQPWCGQPVTMLEIQEPLAGNAAPWFTEYSHSDARDHFHWFLSAWETGLTPAYADQLLAHFEGFTCEPPSRQRRQSGRRVAPAGVLQSQSDLFHDNGSSFYE